MASLTRSQAGHIRDAVAYCLPHMQRTPKASHPMEGDLMEKGSKDMPRTDVGKDMPKHDDGGKTGGELGKQGGADYGKPGEKKEWGGEKKEWEKPKEA